MKKAILFITLYLPLLTYSQVSVYGQVSAGDSVQIKISSVTPIEFPIIEVLFRAENLKKYPYWGLKKTDIKVLEKNIDCEILSLRHFSEQEPINISIVIDHSGSMLGSFIDYLTYYNNDTSKVLEAHENGTLPILESPLGNAVLAVKGFLKNFKNEKDKIGLYTFNDNVDVQIKPTYDITDLNKSLDTLTPNGSTAFFDAVYMATEGLIGLEGINVVIALTDGQDNSSKRHSNEVITLAKENNIPIYCIGLGDAIPDTLQILADSTNGYYAYTNKSSTLDSIYTLLNRKILAYYLMTYTSTNWSSLDTDRELTIEFNQNDIYTLDNTLQFRLPDKVTNYLQEKEQLEFQYLIGGVVGGSILILGLTLFLIYKKRVKKLAIKKLYSNPGNGNCSLEIELGSNNNADIVIIDFLGKEVYRKKFNNGGYVTIDFSHLINGNYILFLQTDKEKSMTKKYIKF